MRRLLLGFAVSVIALPLWAQGAMNAEEFDAYTRNKTFLFGSNGQAYGAEEYLENRRVIWSFLDGQCQYGRWYREGDQICFEYDEVDGPQCWSFTQGPGGLIARFQNDPEATELYEVEKSAEPMVCLGPDVGT